MAMIRLEMNLQKINEMAASTKWNGQTLGDFQTPNCLMQVKKILSWLKGVTTSS